MKNKLSKNLTSPYLKAKNNIIRKLGLFIAIKFRIYRREYKLNNLSKHEGRFEFSTYGNPWAHYSQSFNENYSYTEANKEFLNTLRTFYYVPKKVLKLKKLRDKDLDIRRQEYAIGIRDKTIESTDRSFYEFMQPVVDKYEELYRKINY